MSIFPFCFNTLTLEQMFCKSQKSVQPFRFFFSFWQDARSRGTYRPSGRRRFFSSLSLRVTNQAALHNSRYHTRGPGEEGDARQGLKQICIFFGYLYKNLRMHIRVYISLYLFQLTININALHDDGKMCIYKYDAGPKLQRRKPDLKTKKGLWTAEGIQTPEGQMPGRTESTA